MEDDVGDECLLERRSEALDELGRQTPDEPDRVCHEIALAVVLEPARRRIERLEQSVVDRDLRAGERIQQRRLADVGVAGEGDSRCLGARALLAACRSLGSESAQSLLEERDAAACDPAVGLQLRLPGPARPYSAAEPLEVLPHAAHAGRLYSSCASSTCSLPSALTACCAKMSRISCVRSTTRASRAFSSARC